MKLAILAQGSLLDSTVSINGTLVQLHNLSLAFAKSGLSVHYISITNDVTKPLYQEINGIHFYWILSKKGGLSWYFNKNLYSKVLKSIQPNAIYVRGRNVLQYIAGVYAKKHNVNFIWGTNGDDSAEFWKNLKRLRESRKSFLRKLALFPLKALEDRYINKGMQLATTIINQSEFQQKETKRLLDRKGIVLPSYFLKTECKGIKENCILWLASLSENKQPSVFINLIEFCEVDGWDVILGGGTTNKKFKEEVRVSAKNSGINFIGKVAYDETFRLYCKSKIFVNTSDREGLPNAYIQSWLSGTVVLSLNIDPNGWLKAHNIGFCAHGDVDALKAKLQELINSPIVLQNMSDNAIKFAEETFANQEIINEYIKVFKV